MTRRISREGGDSGEFLSEGSRDTQSLKWRKTSKPGCGQRKFLGFGWGGWAKIVEIHTG